MSEEIAVDIWVRGTQHATTHRITSVPTAASTWSDDDVRRLLSEMLLALDREKNPGGEVPRVTLRGFSWIVSADGGGGVLVQYCVDDLSFLVKLIVKQGVDAAEIAAKLSPGLERRLRSSAPAVLSTQRAAEVARALDSTFGLALDDGGM